MRGERWGVIELKGYSTMMEYLCCHTFIYTLKELVNFILIVPPISFKKAKFKATFHLNFIEGIYIHCICYKHEWIEMDREKSTIIVLSVTISNGKLDKELWIFKSLLHCLFTFSTMRMHFLL